MGVYHWILSLAALSMLGTLFVVMNQIVEKNIYEPITNNTLEPAYNFSVTDRQSAEDWMNFWALIPIVLFGVVVAFLVQRTITARD